MTVRITYCTARGYDRRAASLAAAIRKPRGLDVELKRGSGGIFDVEIDGSLVFPKHEKGRFPSEQEVLEAIGGA
jgi:selT/selW/selH-like putative selenoprotein